MQDAGPSSAGGGPHIVHAGTNAENSRTPQKSGRPPHPQGRTTTAPTLIVLKEGDRIPEGYAYVVEKCGDHVATNTKQATTPRDTVDLSTPPKATEPGRGEAYDTSKSQSAARRNLTRNSNRKANATFVKDLKDSLATGQPMTLKVAEDNTDLKSTWHAAAKEVAYKFLDLTKESWKDYSRFERTVVHNEVNEQYNFDPPIDPKRIDKYLSCHFRTSRAVWKAHWKKNGPSERHRNCPQLAWDKLTKWWSTDACREEAEEMASRRARVETHSKVGRSSLVDRMDEQVNNVEVLHDVENVMCCSCIAIL